MFVVESSDDEHMVDTHDAETFTYPSVNYNGECRHPRRVKILIGEYTLPKAAKEIDINPTRYLRRTGPRIRGYLTNSPPVGRVP
ncbi:hypothetical protein GCM10027355_36310 [Haloplanus salinarum]